MTNIAITVEGMSCSHCENRVKKAVGALAGVSTVAVDLKEGIVTVDYDAAATSADAIREAITDQGYEVV